MSDLDNLLKETLEQRASIIPHDDLLGSRVITRGRRQARRALMSVGAVAAGLVLLAAVALAQILPGDPSGPGLAAPGPAVPDGWAGQALANDDGGGSCVLTYSPQNIAEHLGFAFDGTVTAIGDPVSEGPGDEARLGLVGVTFEVHAWFKGGPTDSVTVDLVPPVAAAPTGPVPGSGETEEHWSAAYTVGTRLLVSGQPRWGGPDPLERAIAWAGCGGFTRYYSAQVAQEWRAAMPRFDTSGFEQPEMAWGDLELRIITGLEDPLVGGVRYEPETDRVVVTVYADGPAIPQPHLDDIQRRAEALAEGIPVVVEVSDEDRPTAAGLDLGACEPLHLPSDALGEQRTGQEALDAAGADLVEFGRDLGGDQTVHGAFGTWQVMPVSDWGVGQVQARTIRDGCPHVFWLPAGTTLQEARDIVRRW